MRYRSYASDRGIVQMSSGQWRVIGLLLFLLLLEILRSDQVQAFFKGLIPGIQ